MLTLSIFPGIGLLDRAFEACGYCVVRGPDVIWGGDIHTFHPPAGVFAGVIGGPPCQTWSSLAHLVRANGHEPKFGNLIPEFERVVAEAQPDWFCMENVRAAPEPVVASYGTKSFLLDNAMLDSGDGHGEEQTRLRRFTFGMRGRSDVPDLRRWIDLATFVLPDAAPNNGVYGKGPTPTQRGRMRRQAVLSDPSAVPVKIGGSGKVKRTAVSAGQEQPDGLTAAKRRKRQAAVTGSDGGASVRMGRYRLDEALRLQGLPPDALDHCPFTAEGKLRAVANGVALPTGRAIAKAIREALTWA